MWATLKTWWSSRAARNDRRGQMGEHLAQAYLRRAGMDIIECNFRVRSGEIDIVAREGQTTVFVEVKERQASAHGEAVEAVTYEKRRRIVRAARIYASRHALSEKRLRFDVIAIDWRGGQAHIRHDRDAFDEDAD
ncbi:MAG: YraN family protein [Vicinamibacteria bacterium]|jgi:putative endonuclease|nr:YraN family protein [Vicinamibacteria bacterium]